MNVHILLQVIGFFIYIISWINQYFLLGLLPSPSYNLQFALYKVKLPDYLREVKKLLTFICKGVRTGIIHVYDDKTAADINISVASSTTDS